MDLSIVVVSHNTRDLLDACLTALAQNSAAISCEVIVVDNASADGSPAMVRGRHPYVRVIEMGINAGFARGSNAGMRAAGGRYILLLNSDTLVLDQAPSQMLSFMEDHAEWAALGPLLLNTDGSIQPSCFAFTTVRDVLFESLGLTALFPASRLFNRRGLGGFDRRRVRQVDWVSGACLLVRRPVIEQIGLLDESFFMYGEELDWCYRMKQSGMPVAFFPGARVVHHGRASSIGARGLLAPRALAGRLRYFSKHHGPGAVLAVRACTVVGMALRLLALPLTQLLTMLPLRTQRRRGRTGDLLQWYWGMLRAAVRGVNESHEMGADERR